MLGAAAKGNCAALIVPDKSSVGLLKKLELRLKDASAQPHGECDNLYTGLPRYATERNDLLSRNHTYAHSISFVR